MINLVKLQCPNCSANLEVDAKLKQCFCQYCGTKLLIDNDNEKTVHIVDEAEMTRAENEYKLLKSHMEQNADLTRMELNKKQFELEKQKAAEIAKKAFFCSILTIVFVFGLMTAAMENGSGRKLGIIIAATQIAFTWISFILLNSQKQTAWKIALGYLLRIAAFGLIIVFMVVTPT